MYENQCDCDNVVLRKEGGPHHYDNCASQLIGGSPRTKNPDGTLIIKNPYLADLSTDHLYHLGLDTSNHDLPALFGDVKFVCMGGTKQRMREFARFISTQLSELGASETQLVNLTKHSHRYAMYKVGPVMSVSHGIGIPSMTILLQEVIKLLFYAKAKDPIIIRIGTSGGLDLAPGSVVVSSFGLSSTLEKSYDLAELGKVRKLPAIFDRRLAHELVTMRRESDSFETYTGGTMTADDFYRGQARLDGPFCQHTAADKMEFLKRLHQLGVKNIEMEATAFAAFTKEAGLRAADVCVTLIDRLKGDQLKTSKETMMAWQQRPMLIVGRYIKEYLRNLPS